MKPTSHLLNRVMLLSLLLILSSASLSYGNDKRQERVTRRVEKQLKQWENPLKGWSHTGKIAIDSLSVLPSEKVVRLFFTRALSYIPLREDNVALLESSVKESLGRRYRDFRVEMSADGHPLGELIPNAFRSEMKPDVSRNTLSRREERIPLVQRSGNEKFTTGLYNNNIALWNSHGWYFESKLDRWEWQRPRLFGTAEDIFTKGFVVPFLIPMLENSGATVLIPTERDVSKKEVIVDNDFTFEGGRFNWPDGFPFTSIDRGFRWKDTLFSGENPFMMGSSLLYACEAGKTGEVTFIPPALSGEYAVYLSWQSFENSCKSVKYSVHASGGVHEFTVNQQMGGGTWTYIGTFHFDGNESDGEPGQFVSVGLSGNRGEVISIDAVRFGGGMGNVARRPADSVLPNVRSVEDAPGNAASAVKIIPEQFSWKISGKSRYREGARYYLQYAGFPDSLVYDLNDGRNDYNDDYMSRGEWVNYLMGSPNGPQKNKNATGLKIPVDLAMAFHSDAGITPGDSIIGTLGIYSTWADKGLFPDGTSRLASRDLADLIQTQIVEDVRDRFRENWTRRGLWDRQYSEAWRPNVPVMLLELLSHQNLADMKYGLDPRFRFTVSRAIYKGMLKFLASRENRSYTVQPLPVSHFSLSPEGNSSVRVTWKPVADPQEPSAFPTHYKVYHRIGRQGFDAGITVNDTTVVIPLGEAGVCHSFRVTALNGGGESFPSEVLSVGLAPESKGMVLIVNVFDRVSGPATFDSGRKAGVEWWRDQGVAWNFSSTTSGNQYDYDRKSDWTDDDNPGWGSSYANLEDLTLPGNNFDFTINHGAAFLEAGYSYVSASDEAFSLPGFPVRPFFAVDLLLGEEKAIPSLKDSSQVDFRIYTPEMMKKLQEIADNEGNILLTGAYCGSDFFDVRDTVAASFVRKTLHFIRRTGNASTTGDFYSADYGKKWFSLNGHFNTEYHPSIYQVEAPDGLEPAGVNAFTIFRYLENNVSAGVAYRGKYRTVALGFPLETITSGEVKNRLVTQILQFFEEK